MTTISDPAIPALFAQIMDLLSTKGVNTSEVPFAFSYERNADTQQMEWTAYVDHRSLRGHYDLMTTGETAARCLSKLVHRLKRELL